MKKTTSLILAATLATTVGLAALTPAMADGRKGQDRGNGEHHQRMGQGGPGGGFMRLICSDEGASRLESGLSRVSSKIELTDDQKTLFNDFKSVALTAQTEFADNCTVPARNDNTNIVDRIKLRQVNMAAQLSAMDEVIPAFEAFHNSLTDAQKTDLQPTGRGKGRGGHRGGRHNG